MAKFPKIEYIRLILNIKLFFGEKMGKTFKVGDAVEVPKGSSELGDSWKYAFVGNVIGFRDGTNLVKVEDKSNNVFDVESERLTSVEYISSDIQKHIDEISYHIDEIYSHLDNITNLKILIAAKNIKQA